MERLSYLMDGLIYKYLQSKNKRLKDTQIIPHAILATDDIGLQINIFGRYETEILDVLSNQLFSSLKRGACLDIGANIGNHTIVFAQHFTEVHSFEPNPTTSQLLKFNTQTLDCVKTHSLAISNFLGTCTISGDLLNSGKSKICTLPNESTSNTKVTTITLDNFLQTIRENIVFIKIDVEGHELEVLQGGKNYLKEHKPCIVLEVLKDQISNGKNEALELLQAMGYSKFWEIEIGGSLREKFISFARNANAHLLVIGFLAIVFGKPKAKMKPINPQALSSKNYNAIIAR